MYMASTYTSQARDYDNFFNNSTSSNKREDNAVSITDHYYTLVTDFYEYGWGRSFHFTAPYKNESYNDAIIRHEMYLAFKLNIKSESNVLDAGCCVDGPLSNIARFTAANITGITINEYQVNKANSYLKEKGLNKCKVIQGDYHNLPFPDNTFDAIYIIEAACHSGTRDKLFKEMFRVLKPGGMFGSYDWGMTENMIRQITTIKKLSI